MSILHVYKCRSFKKVIVESVKVPKNVGCLVGIQTNSFSAFALDKGFIFQTPFHS